MYVYKSGHKRLLNKFLLLLNEIDFTELVTVCLRFAY